MTEPIRFCAGLCRELSGGGLRGRSNRWERPLTVYARLLIVLFLTLCSGCASATGRARLQPSDVVSELIQFHGAVSDQYQAGGMELEHFLIVTSWIGDVVRVVLARPEQWEGQMRLEWGRVRSIIVPFEALQPWARKIDRLLQ